MWAKVWEVGAGKFMFRKNKWRGDFCSVTKGVEQKGNAHTHPIAHQQWQNAQLGV
jgi:hypothetical protein